MTKYSLLFLSLICAFCSIPLMHADSRRPPGTGPKAKMKSIPLVIIEIESGIIDLTFTNDLGEVYVELQNVGSSITEFSGVINTSIQNGDSFYACTGTYILTVTHADGTILAEANIVIP